MQRKAHFIIALALVASANATDRVVSPTGTFNTISSAIAASNDGDRILVQPGTYIENLQLNRPLSMLPSVEGGRYTVTGLAYVGLASGGSITLSGIRLTSGILVESAHTTRTDIAIIDSYVETFSLVDPFIRVELYRDTLGSGGSASSLGMFGCQVNGDFNTGASIAINGTTLLADELTVIGNSIGAPTGGTGVQITSSRVFHVENNFIRTSPSATPAVTFYRTSNYGAAPSTVINNTFYKHVAQAAVAVSNTGPLSPLVLKNNILVGFNNGASSPTGANWPQLLSDHNTQTAPSSINTTTGQPLNGSLLLIDAGDPAPRYLDLDLTTNDLGCYGGSNSRANFTTAMGSAVVGFMRAPRVVSQGDAVNIQATGFDR